MKKLTCFALIVYLCACCLCAGSAEVVVLNDDAGVWPVLTQKHPRATVLPRPMDDNTLQPLLEIWFGKVNVCDCIAVRCEGKTMLIDGGNKPNGGATRGFLNGLHFHRADYIYNTHHHDDHIDMEAALVSRGEFWATTFLTPYERDHPVQRQLAMQQAVDDAGIEYRMVRDGDTLSLGGATFEFHRWTGSTDPNYSSLFAKVTYKNRSIWLMADVTGLAQQHLAEERKDIDWKADVFKLGHHGYSEQDIHLLRMVDPELCVITNTVSGAKVSIKQLKRNGYPYLLTNFGTIYLYTDGGDHWYYQQDSTPYDQL